MDISLPGLTALDDLIFSIQKSNDWEMGAVNFSLVVLNLLFTTAPHAGSLAGLIDGSIVGTASFVASNYNNLSGSINADYLCLLAASAPPSQETRPIGPQLPI